MYDAVVVENLGKIGIPNIPNWSIASQKGKIWAVLPPDTSKITLPIIMVFLSKAWNRRPAPFAAIEPKSLMMVVSIQMLAFQGDWLVGWSVGWFVCVPLDLFGGVRNYWLVVWAQLARIWQKPTKTGEAGCVGDATIQSAVSDNRMLLFGSFHLHCSCLFCQPFIAWIRIHPRKRHFRFESRFVQWRGAAIDFCCPGSCFCCLSK